MICFQNDLWWFNPNKAKNMYIYLKNSYFVCLFVVHGRKCVFILKMPRASRNNVNVHTFLAAHATRMMLAGDRQRSIALDGQAQ